MTTIQQYFDDNFKRSNTIIAIPKISEELKGNVLIVENYLDLTQLDLKELPQVEELIIKNCPKLSIIKYNQKQKPVIIQPETKKCDWRCFALAASLLWSAFLTYYVFKFIRNHKRKCSICKN